MMFRAPMAAALVAAGLPAANAGCACIYQGELLPQDIIDDYPTDDPGKYKNYSSIRAYGTTCAAWESVPNTPWFGSCDLTKLMNEDHNYCAVPWCYVDSTCDSKISTELFDGASPQVYYSYQVCGGINCYGADNFEANDCPYDPNGENTGRVDKKADCKCKYYGETLATNIYTDYPNDDAGKYMEMSNIELYGTSCAAWDQVPGTPWASDYCPQGKDWCHKDYNWCQAPWCYVASGCNTGVETSVFQGSAATKYSYDTCQGTPNCYGEANFNATDACPYSPGDDWYTAKDCSEEDMEGDGSPASWGVSALMSLMTLFALNR